MLLCVGGSRLRDFQGYKFRLVPNLDFVNRGSFHNFTKQLVELEFKKTREITSGQKIMDLSTLTAISPLDGRYRRVTKDLADYFSG